MSELNKEQIALARKNREVSEESWQKLRGRQIVKRVRRRRSADDELAILRKAVACLFDVVASLHQGEINNAEFALYHTEVEAIKREVDDLLEEKSEV